MDRSVAEKLSLIGSGNAPQPFPESMTGSTDPSIATDHFTYIPSASADLRMGMLTVPVADFGAR